MLNLRNRLLRRAAAACLLIALTSVGVAVAASGGAGRPTSGTAYIGSTPRSSNNLIYSAGFNVDRVLGSGAVTFTIKPLASSKPATIKAQAKKVTLWTSNGSLSGTGTATIKITGKPKSGDATVSGGRLNLNHGTGGQAGHSLVATFTGKGNVVSGQYVFHYKGRYR